MEPLPAPLRPPAPDRVVVHASLRGLLTAALTPVALAALGTAAIVDGGPRLLPVLLVLGGVLLAGVVLGDVPRRAEFDRRGLTRVCWLRRQHVPWDRVVAIERTRPSSGTVARNLVGAGRGSSRQARVSGGLVARGRGRRRWLLTDRVESRDEHDQLRRLLAAVDTPVVLRAATPHEGVPPTHLYRRRGR